MYASFFLDKFRPRFGVNICLVEQAVSRLSSSLLNEVPT